MRLEGERRFEAPRATVWRVLNDPASMAQTMPGVESFDVADDRHWKAHVKIPLGLGGLRMSVSFEKTEEHEPDYAKLHAKGDGVGAIMNMDTAFHLEDAEGGGTAMHWEADVRIAGPVGSMGQRVLQPIVNQQVSHVLTALEQQVQEASGGREEEPASGSARAPEPTTDRPPPETDPEPKDSGPPAEGPAEPEGTSGGEEGLNPLAPESYEPEPEGPTTSTED
ncbi:MAG TPA: SRPBCC domain-containing protein [Gaiellaceae bacterium]|nr:SRPBCC domain-containing protein [Gaiellaceae bacterium]